MEGTSTILSGSSRQSA